MTEHTLSMDMTLEEAKKRYENFSAFSKSIMKSGLDFGQVTGVSKPSLLKPGAEKLRLVYGLGVETERVDEKMDIDKDFYDVTYKTTVRDKGGRIIAQCEGSASTFEEKYRYRRIKHETRPSNRETMVARGMAKETNAPIMTPTTKKPSKEEANKLKLEGKGQRKKEGEGNFVRYEYGGMHTVFHVKEDAQNRIGNKNTIQKMAQKRSFVGAILLATGASEFYTQDVEDMVVGDSSSAIIASDDTQVVDTPSKQVFTHELLDKLCEKIRTGQSQYDTVEDLFKKLLENFTIPEDMEQIINQKYEEAMKLWSVSKRENELRQQGKSEGEILDDILNS